MRRPARILAWSGVLALLAAPIASPRRGPPTSEEGRSLAARLLGPVGALAASVQWVRFDAALDAGRPELAYARAGLALRLDPGGTEGWSYLAAHLALARGSAEVEPDPQRRAGWYRAALEVLERGEARARDPGALALQRGLYLATIAESEGAILWPGGAPAARSAAADAFERAGELGRTEGREFARKLRAPQ